MLLVILGSLGHSATSIAGTTVALRESYAGNLSFELTGGSFRTNHNNSNACSVATSSSQSFNTLPLAATVVKAYLYWAGSGTSNDNQVTLNGNTVTSDRLYTETWDTNRHFYNGVADVTSLVSTYRNTTYTVSGLTIDTSNTYCDRATVLGGWALMVIYEEDSEDFRVINVYEGFQSFQHESFTLIPNNFELPTNPSGKHAHITWEGDDTLGTDGEYLTFEGNLLTDSPTQNAPDNQFDSYSNVQNGFISYGVDIDEYDISDMLVAGATQVTTTYSAGQDLVLLSAEIVSVSNIPVADLSVTTSDPTGWLQGSTVTKKYTISNNGPNDIPVDSVRFTASLPPGVSFTGTQGDSDWSCTPNPNSGDTISCVFNTKLRSGWSDYLDLTFKVDDGTAGNILDIDVSVDHDLAPYNIFDNQQTNNSYQFSVPIGSVAVIDLSASSKVHTNLSGDLLLAGDTLRYTITLDDASNLPVTGITVTDKLPDNISGYNVISSPVAAVFSTTGGSDTGTLTFNNITLTDTAPGDTQEIIFEVTIDSSAPRGSSLQNQATISQGASNWLVDTGDITVVEPDLSPSTKTASDLNNGILLLPQETVRYVITLNDAQNLELSGLQLTDHMPDYIVSYTVSGLPAGATDVGSSSGGNNGTGLIDIRNITVPAGGTVQIQIDAVVDANAPDGTPMKNTADLILGSQIWPVTSSDLYVELIVSTPKSGNKPLYLLNNKLSRNLPNIDYVVVGNHGDTSIWTIDSRLQSELILNSGDIRLNLAVEGYRAGNITTTLSPTLYYNDNKGGGDINIVSGEIPAGSYKINKTSEKTLDMNLASPITIPEGSSIYLKIDNTASNNSNNPWARIDIHSINGDFRSEIILNTSTVINVDSITVWDAPYGDMNGTGNGKLLTDSEYKGDLYIRAQISDPFGAFDISGATITAKKPGGSWFSFPLNSDMSQADNPSDDYFTGSKIYEKQLDISNESDVEGVWEFSITGYEGLETGEDQVTHDAATSFLVKPIININLSPSTKQVYAVSGSLQAGETIHYTFTIKEASGAVLNGIQITDNLPANIESFTLGDLPAGATDHSIINGGTNITGYIDIRNINLAADEVIEIHLDAVVKSDAPDGASLLNTASFIFAPQDWLITSNDLLVNTDTTAPESGNKPLYLVSNSLTRVRPTTNAIANIANRETKIWTIAPNIQSELILIAGDLPLNLALEGQQTDNNRSTIVTANLYYNENTNNSPDRGIVSGLFPSARYDNGIFYPLTLNMNLNTETRIPAGSTIYLSINNKASNGQVIATNSIDIHSFNEGFFSAAVLNAKTVINVDKIEIWSAPFLDNDGDFEDDSGAAIITSSFPDTTVSIRATISDPFGAFDITGATISYPNPNPDDDSATTDAAMTAIDDSTNDLSTTDKIFEAQITLVEADIDLIQGNWNISITGLEGYEDDVTHTKTARFLVKPFLPTIALSKTINVVYDPINIEDNPKAIPGALIRYTINVINTGRGKSDENSIILQDEIPENSELFIGDLECTSLGQDTTDGPVCYQDTPPPNGSGLAYNYDGTIGAIDGVSFSINGTDFNHEPVNSGGFDSNIRYIRITPTGFFNNVTIDGTGNPENQPEFNFSYQIRLN